MMALVVAIAGIMFPAMAESKVKNRSLNDGKAMKSKNPHFYMY